MSHPINTRLSIVIALALMSPPGANAQQGNTSGNAGSQASKSSAQDLDAVRVTGSRARGRTVDDSPAPVDIISSTELKATGATEVGQILQTLAPSFNFSRTFVSDGTDIIRPATLRSLGSDQVLVLVNGKRRHQQALVNVQQTVARGQAGTDINAIPISAVDRIEVLRDGAAAQYGSDAIAGVINIILKHTIDQTDVSLQGGSTYKGDGNNYSVGANTGFALGKGGYLNLTGEYRKRGETNRAGPDLLRVNPPRVTQHLGDADALDQLVWFNAAVPMPRGEVYAFGGYSRRRGSSFGFFRSAGDNRTVPALYPNGFLPNIVTKVEDKSISFGYRAPINDKWDMDVSVTRGQNSFGYSEHNTVNVSWWYEPKPGGGIYAQSPTEANTGTLKFDETTVNLDFSGQMHLGSLPMSLATGAEWRKDTYTMTPGEDASWMYGRTNNPAIVINGQRGTTAAAGTQGFPGFTPATAVHKGRDNWAVYLDTETNLSESFLLGVAGRHERYSDFGDTTIGKLSARWNLTPAFALRGSLSTGFRAPSVQQEYYSQVSTNLKNGALIDVVTARQGSAVTRGLGISDLKQETSKSGSIGFVYKPSTKFSVSADLFRIDINDRIVFSTEIGPESVGTNGQPCTANNSNCPLAAVLVPLHVGAAQFFTNAIDTRTTGLDVTANWGIDLAHSKLDLTGLMHFNQTKVTGKHSPSTILPASVLFDETQQMLIEHGQPRQHHMLQAVWSKGRLELLGRANYYGPVSGMGFTGLKQTWGGKTLFDASVRWKFTKNASLAVGANNIFDTYPDKWKAGVTDPNNPGFNNPFPALGFIYGWETLPFGMNGGSYYARLDLRF